MGSQVNQLLRALADSLAETLQVLAELHEEELDEADEHPCAMGGTVRDLLTHNIDHERMHLGQLYSARYALKQMQKHPTDRLLAETLRARADLMAALVGLPDAALDAPIPDEDWTVRQMIEHTLYWERHSVNHLLATRLAGRAAPPEQRLTLNVQDPAAGPLNP